MKRIALACALFIFLLAGPALAAGELIVFTWAEYIDPEVIKGFEEKHGVKVRLDYYESNEEMVAKLQSGGLGQYDLIVPSTYSVPSLKNLNLVEPLNHELLPNLKNLEPEFTRMEEDPGNRFTVPYGWGTTGLAVKTKDPSSLKASWALLYDPGIEVGNFTILGNARDALASALKYLGYSLNTTDPGQIKEAIALLTAAKKRPSFIGFDAGLAGLNKALSGLSAVAHSYSGEAQRAGQEDPEIHYLIPEEGTEIWADLVAIPRLAPNAKNAHDFINYLLDPEVGARQAAYNCCATPNAAAKAFVPPEDLNNPTMYPDLSQLKNMEYIRDLGTNNRLYDEAWTLIKTQ